MPAPGRVAVVELLGGQRRELEERRARVAQPLDAVAREQLAARDVALAAPRSPPPARTRASRASRSAISARCPSRSRSRGVHRHAAAGAARPGRPAASVEPARPCPACGAVIDSSIFIDSSTSRTSPSATGVAVGDVDEQHRAGHRRLERAGAARRRRARAARSGARLEVVAVAGDPDASPSTRDRVAARRRRRASTRSGRGVVRVAAGQRPRRARPPPPAPPVGTRTSPCPSKRAAPGPGRRRPAVSPRQAATAAAGSRSSAARESSSSSTRSSSPVSCSPARTSSRAQQRAGEGGVRRRRRASSSSPARGRGARSAVARSGAVGDDLGEHRVVARADLRARADAGVDADARPAGGAVRADGARSRGGSRSPGPRRRGAPRPRGRAGAASAWRERERLARRDRAAARSTRSTP